MEKGTQLPNGLIFLDMIWFSNLKGSFGLLKSKNSQGQVKLHIGMVPGKNEDIDICYIAANGTKVDYKLIFTFLSRWNNGYRV